jgi:hypothetical protein
MEATPLGAIWWAEQEYDVLVAIEPFVDFINFMNNLIMIG